MGDDQLGILPDPSEAGTPGPIAFGYGGGVTEHTSVQFRYV